MQDVSASVKEYVSKAIAKYDDDGLDSVITHYNGQDSLDGQFYLFLIGEDDIYLAHPIFPHLIGTDIKDVVGSDGQSWARRLPRPRRMAFGSSTCGPIPIPERNSKRSPGPFATMG